MGEPLPEQVLDTAVDPVEIAQQTFDTERRGFDQRQVQQYLRAIADSLQDAQQREADMRRRLGRAVRRAENAEHALRNAPEHDPAEHNRELGDQVASVLEAARVAGEQRAAAAEKSASQMIANAKADAAKTRSEADSVLQARQAEAERVAAEIVAAAQAEAQALRDQSAADTGAKVAAAAEKIERTRAECDGLIREAEEARAQILEDMERRRRQARAQVERLRVGRDRLLRSYEVVRRTLEETTVELKSSLNEAKVRGDGAARAVTSEPLASREQLEAELRDAKMIGRITLSDPVLPAREKLDVAGVLRSPALPRRLDTPSAQPAPTAANKSAASTSPKAPASAPALKASAVADADEDPIAAMMAAAEAKRVGFPAPELADLDRKPADPELAQLEDDDLNVVAPADEIEQVMAVPTAKAQKDSTAKAPGLFEALRAQRAGRKRSSAAPSNQPESSQPESSQSESRPADSRPADSSEAESTHAVTEADIAAIKAQRDAVIADAAKQLEKRLKRALADEQNDILASLRGAKKKRVELTTIVGDVDKHINRYVVAIHEVAAVTYGAGAAIVDADVDGAERYLPAGAVEELLESDVVLPIRERLASLDGLQVAAANMHVDPVRAFYRQRKTDHLGPAASRLASLLCVAGLCDALPEESPVPPDSVAK